MSRAGEPPRGRGATIDRRGVLAGAGAFAAAMTAKAAAAPLRFPDGFVWGTATSAYQIEGRAGRRGECIWDTFCRQPGKIRDGANGDVACDHYHRYRDDVALMASGAIAAYRFSVAWPRVLPDGTGAPDEAGLDFYDRLTDALLAAGIAPWVCLYHWDLPQRLQDRGGWGSRDIAGWFADYAVLMARRLGDRAHDWVMLNEPSVHALIGHGLGEHAPGLTSPTAMFAAMHHQNLAQGRALAALRGLGGKRLRLGTVLSLQPVRPVGGLAENQGAAALWDALWNRGYLDPLFHGRYPPLMARDLDKLVQPGDLDTIRQKLDFLGVNYYSRMYRRTEAGGFLGTSWGALPPGTRTTGMGWPIEPDGLAEVLLDLRDHYGNPPVYITENGVSFPEARGSSGRVDDTARIAFLRDHLAAAHRALIEGADLRGYFAWTILDNFEWAWGYTAPFGLVRVDRATLGREPKASFDWFARVIRGNSID